MNRFGFLIIVLYLYQFLIAFIFRNFEINYAQLIFLVLTSVYMIFLMMKGRVRFPTYLGFYLAYVVYVTFMYSFARDYGWLETAKFMLGRPFLASFFMLFFIENYQINNEKLSYIIKTIYYITIFSSIYLMFQLVLPDYFLRFYNANIGFTSKYSIGQRGYIKSPFSWIGSNVGSISMLAFYLLTVANLKKIPLYKIRPYLIAMIMLLYMILIQARYLMLLAIIALMALLILSQKKILQYWKVVLVMGILVYALLTVLSMVGFNVYRFYERRIMSETSQSRVGAVDFFLSEYPKNPVYGTGGVISNELERQLVGFSSQIHVGYLSLFYYYGLIGGIAFLLALFFFFKEVWKDARSSGYWGSFAFILGYALSVETTLVLLHFGAQGLAIAKMLSNAYRLNLPRVGKV